MNLIPKDVGAVIVTYKRPEALKKTIFAILSQDIPESQIVIVNNDPSIQLIPEHIDISFTRLVIKNQLENIASAGGFAKGMKAIVDMGLKWAWLFNDDSRPVEGSFFSIKTALENTNYEKIGLIKIGNLNQTGKAILLNWNGVRVPSYVDPSEELIKTDLVTFDGCLISCLLIEDIGTCDPGYFMGTYEFDYCLKAAKKGYKIFTLPNGQIEDEKMGSVGGTPPWRQYYNTRNHLWMGISRRDFRILRSWLLRELKFTYAILMWEDQKILRLRYKFLAMYHAAIGRRGKVLMPKNN
ncbi:glycosyltransferase family protein [Algoriphagus taiwanensis]|uniref:Glycosyltransferase family 2 protein n=1 Tax=Algoriphagus taiwanensis TaxID=1445656 RepID=A0ABQ6Q785_9BACT|nr:glycosyltransferase family 2 protein [Algoriphagus taiwanensis]